MVMDMSRCKVVIPPPLARHDLHSHFALALL
jgi:hypothetical protein